MINANDLMRNNWILDAMGDPVQVKNLVTRYELDEHGEEQEIVCINNLSSPNAEHSPIPLTPELMVKTKAVKTGEDYFTSSFSLEANFGFLIELIFFLNETREGGKVIYQKGDVYFNTKLIHYLHELQNMYRWETGTHLNITL